MRRNTGLDRLLIGYTELNQAIAAINRRQTRPLRNRAHRRGREVYKANDTRLDRTVAIKTSKTEFNERFEREARAVAALNHSNICQLYDVGPNYLVMEYIEGTPLKGPLPLDQTLKYAAQICDVLDAAQKKGITHRDLKPANILVTRQGIKLLDFGLAKLSATAAKPIDDATVAMALTGKNEIVGTLFLHIAGTSDPLVFTLFRHCLHVL